MEIIWLPKAEDDFVKDIEYLEVNFSRKTATEYMTIVYEAIEKISDVEKALYQLVNADKNIYRYQINKHKHLYYRILEDKIELLTFWDSRQNPDKLKL